MSVRPFVTVTFRSKAWAPDLYYYSIYYFNLFLAVSTLVYRRLSHPRASTYV